MKLTRSRLQAILAGSTILGMGGGGRYDAARERIKDVQSVNLISINEVPEGSLVITAYGAGGLTKQPVSPAALLRGLRLLQKRLGKPIGAIVPVEIGPYSLAEAFWIAAQLKVPVVDADLVGCRSVPEIFIELVTLADLSRCPLVFGNNEGDLLVLENDSTPERLEEIIRSFAAASISNTFVFGYPYDKPQLRKAAASGTVSYCLEVQKALETNFQLVGTGKVTSDSKREMKGFTQGRLTIQQGGAKLAVVYKNEYLVLLKNNKVVVTCPDSIVVVDTATGLGLNNGEDNIGKQIAVYIRAAIPQWQTAAARELFSPKALGLPYNQKVLRG